MTRMPMLGALLGVLLALLLPSQALARGVNVNLTASWPSSPFFPLLETSEFLAEENPLYFWQFAEKLESHMTEIEKLGGDVDALAELAITVAEEIAPESKNILELMLATRAYSVKVEMFRQLALDSGVRPCGADADTWAVFYREPHCVEAVACSVDELEALLRGDNQTAVGEEACVVAGVNDVELGVDHKYPHLSPSTGPQPVSGILYGLMGTPTFHLFHNKLVELAKTNEMQYMVRHYPQESSLETLLQGYGVALDIKNMEYKTIDDSKKSSDEEDLGAFDDEEDEGEEMEIDEDELEGFFFKPLMERHDAIADELKQFHDSLAKQQDADQQEEIKAWHLKDLGMSASRAIVDAKNPLKKLQTLAQDFPLHARKLAFSRKTISSQFREEVETARLRAGRAKLSNKFILNGIAVDPLQRSFNIFDFMKTLKEEWSVAKQLAGLPLNQSELDEMLEHVRDISQEQPAVRIHVRGALDGSTPLYLNNIETDVNAAKWSSDVVKLTRPAWNLIFLRKNMYECVLVFDPLTSGGRTALGHMSFMRMRGAPIQWGFLVSSKELMAAKTSEDRRALVEEWKTRTTEDKATVWHFTKLLMLAQSKDAAAADLLNADLEEEAKATAVHPTTVATAFLRIVGDDSSPDVLVSGLLDAYAEATEILGTTVENGAEALALLQSDRFDEEVLAMTEYIHLKHLPLDSSLFNGVLKKSLDVQKSVMSDFGRDQPLYVAMAHQGLLDNDMDLVDELMASQEEYPAYLSIFESAEVDKNQGGTDLILPPKHLLADDVDGRLEEALQYAVSYLHAPDSLTVPKKQTVIFPADLSDPHDAAYVYQVVKTVAEDSEKDLRVGVVHHVTEQVVTGSEEGQDAVYVGELVAAILAAIGDSDNEAHLKFVLEALQCVIKKKDVAATISKLKTALQSLKDDEDKEVSGKKSVYKKIEELLQREPDQWLTSEQREVIVACNTLLHSRFPPSSTAEASAGLHLFINGRRVDLPAQSLSSEDVETITNFDLKYRTQPVARALIKRRATLTAEEADDLSLAIMKMTGVVDKYVRTARTSRLAVSEGSSNVVQLPGDPSLQVSAYVDPLSEAAQMMSSMLLMLHTQLNATVELVLLPADEYTEFPLQRFYRYSFEKKPSLSATNVNFRKLPVKPILTMKIETPEAWNVQILHAGDDLDNLRVDPSIPAEVKSTTSAVFRLESLLVYGQCRDMTFNQYSPPNGLQLVLERELGAVRLHRDTLVMKNLGYFQLQATPGVWSLHLARGRAAELFDIIDADTDVPLETQDVSVYDFGSHVMQLMVRKKAGMELEELLKPSGDDAGQSQKASDVEPLAEDTGIFGSYWNSMMSLMGKSNDDESVPTEEATDSDESPVDSSTSEGDDAALVPSKTRTGETIHVFSLASGYLYERFLKIMMSSVLKRTNNPVTFWLLENFLSPDFKQSIPVLREEFGMDIRLVTYKWPNWLRQQTEKQRIIWGYKILFLDVLFPLGVQKIIYVDADQVVRADLKELWDMDLDGAPYGYTPFCDSRNVGFQFWRQGYWKDHLRGKPYHISALYVVDLALFRQIAAGDMLRAVYSQLSADPNSLSNLDQDLPNYAQHQIRIFSLPQEWLWCESWCSDDTKAAAKTIDLCNNPKHKEPKLDMAKRVIAGELFNESWIELDQEIKDAEAQHLIADKEA